MLREKYDGALENRRAAGQNSRDKRAARNAAKESFIMTYVEVMALVEAAFPRDKVMQDLFFDEVRTKSAAAIADEDGDDVGDDEAGTKEGEG